MRRVLVVENNAALLAGFATTLREALREELEPLLASLASDAIGLIENSALIDSVEFAVVDLELGLEEGAGGSPEDFDGRDVVLRALRERAPWIPVILTSHFLTGDPLVLAEVTPYGFDIVVPKRFFTESRTYSREWSKVRKLLSVARIAALTGRDTHSVLKLLEMGIEPKYGMGVEEEIAKYDKEYFTSALRLMGFGSDRIILDEIVQGFSGLSVAKVTCKRGAKEIAWLLKFGSAIGKLSREASAHRRMFVDGLTRRFSVPLLWWQPVVWGSVGMIAYEFEEGTQTFLRYAQASGLEKAVRSVKAPLSQLYEGGDVGSVIPRRVLERLVHGVDSRLGGHDESGILKALIAHERLAAVDNSVRVRLGPQHGDLHSRNILIGEKRAVLIDFAHYIGAGEHGTPLLDFAKLCVDLWAFVDELKLDELFRGDVLRRHALGQLGRLALIGSEPTEDEERLFRGGIRCYLAKYAGYDDVPDHKKAEALRALANDWAP